MQAGNVMNFSTRLGDPAPPKSYSVYYGVLVDRSWVYGEERVDGFEYDDTATEKDLLQAALEWNKIQAKLREIVPDPAKYFEITTYSSVSVGDSEIKLYVRPYSYPIAEPTVSEGGSIQYSEDDGSTWADVPEGGVQLTGDLLGKLQFKFTAPTPEDGYYYVADEIKYCSSIISKTGDTVIVTVDMDNYFPQVSFVQKPIPQEAENGAVAIDLSNYDSLIISQDSGTHVLTTTFEGETSSAAYSNLEKIHLTGAVTGNGVDAIGPRGNSYAVIHVDRNVTGLELFLEDVDISCSSSYAAPLSIHENAEVILNVAGENTLHSGSYASGILQWAGSDLTIQGEGALTAQGGDISAAGIGYRSFTGAENTSLTITGSVTVTAIAGGNSAGIGGTWIASSATDAMSIVIDGDATVTAIGGGYGAGIGGARYSNATSITIGGNATVTATGGTYAAGIGGGAGDPSTSRGGHPGKISIGGSAKVTAMGGMFASAIGRGFLENNEPVTAATSDSIQISNGVTLLAMATGNDNYFAVDLEVDPTVTVNLLNARFLAGELPLVQAVKGANPINVIDTADDHLVKALEMPSNTKYAGQVYRAFALTLPEGTYKVQNGYPGAELDFAEYKLVGGDEQFKFTVQSNNMTARDELKFHSFYIVASAGPNGSISNAGMTAVAANGSKTYTFTPDSGYVVGEVTVDGQVVASASSYTFSNVTGNHAIHVSFDSDPNGGGGGGGTPSTYYNVTVNYYDRETGGQIAASHTQRIREGQSYNVSAYDAIPIAGYSYDSTSGDALSGTMNGNKIVNVYYVVEQEIPDEETPTGETPSVPTDPADPTELDGLETITDPEVPMADAPETGDMSLLWFVTAAMFAAGLAWLTLCEKKSKREDG